MEERKVTCNECGKRLFETLAESNGIIASQAQCQGFHVKNAALFSDEFSWLFFCNEQCGKEFYRKNIKRDPEMSQKLQELKAKVPEMAKECSQTVSQILKLSGCSNRPKQ